jgi:hypothetical protein
LVKVPLEPHARRSVNCHVLMLLKWPRSGRINSRIRPAVPRSLIRVQPRLATGRRHVGRSDAQDIGRPIRLRRVAPGPSKAFRRRRVRERGRAKRVEAREPPSKGCLQNRTVLTRTQPSRCKPSTLGSGLIKSTMRARRRGRRRPDSCAQVCRIVWRCA